jgi:hypothetical protein
VVEVPAIEKEVSMSDATTTCLRYRTCYALRQGDQRLGGKDYGGFYWVHLERAHTMYIRFLNHNNPLSTDLIKAGDSLYVMGQGLHSPINIARNVKDWAFWSAVGWPFAGNALMTLRRFTNDGGTIPLTDAFRIYHRYNETEHGLARKGDDWKDYCYFTSDSDQWLAFSASEYVHPDCRRDLQEFDDALAAQAAR